MKGVKTYKLNQVCMISDVNNSLVIELEDKLNWKKINFRQEIILIREITLI